VVNLKEVITILRLTLVWTFILSGCAEPRVLTVYEMQEGTCYRVTYTVRSRNDSVLTERDPVSKEMCRA
jgi:hypothetical protein